MQSGYGSGFIPQTQTKMLQMRLPRNAGRRHWSDQNLGGSSQAGRGRCLQLVRRVDASDPTNDGQLRVGLRLGQPGVLRVDIRSFLSADIRSEEHTSELQSLMRISYAVFCLKKKNKTPDITKIHT